MSSACYKAGQKNGKTVTGETDIILQNLEKSGKMLNQFECPAFSVWCPDRMVKRTLAPSLVSTNISI